MAAHDEVVVGLAHWTNQGRLWVLISEREFDSGTKKEDRPQRAKLPKGKYEFTLRLIGPTVPLASLIVQLVVTEGDISVISTVG